MAQAKIHPKSFAEAPNYPGGWVYEIAGKYGPEDAGPPENTVGAWEVGQASSFERFVPGAARVPSVRHSEIAVVQGSSG